MWTWCKTGRSQIIFCSWMIKCKRSGNETKNDRKLKTCRYVNITWMYSEVKKCLRHDKWEILSSCLSLNDLGSDPNSCRWCQTFISVSFSNKTILKNLPLDLNRAVNSDGRSTFTLVEYFCYYVTLYFHWRQILSFLLTLLRVCACLCV